MTFIDLLDQHIPSWDPQGLTEVTPQHNLQQVEQLVSLVSTAETSGETIIEGVYLGEYGDDKVRIRPLHKPTRDGEDTVIVIVAKLPSHSKDALLVKEIAETTTAEAKERKYKADRETYATLLVELDEEREKLTRKLEELDNQ